MQISVTNLIALLALYIITVSATATDIDFASLLRRQAPGTEKYKCHEACGTAITLSKKAEFCKNEAFVTVYKACLDCAGPDKQDIWSIYGRTLTTAGKACGLPTEPTSGSATTSSVGPGQTNLPQNTSVSTSTVTPSSSGSINETISTTRMDPPAQTSSDENMSNRRVVVSIFVMAMAAAGAAASMLL